MMGPTIIVVGENAEEAAAWLRSLLAEHGEGDITVGAAVMSPSAAGDPVRTAFRAQFEAASRAAEAEWEASMEKFQRDKGEKS